MNSIFSYESKPMQVLMFVGDLIILNAIYILCCIPIFTIGAAQAGMFTAVRVLQDPEDDSSPTAAFFRGFTNGFGRVTLAWGLMTVILVLVGISALYAYALGLPAWLCVLPFAICALFQTLIPVFHSRFDCTVKQLIRNTWFLAFAHPLRSILTVAIIWVPGVVFALDTYRFMSLTIIWITLYFSTGMLFGHLFLRKPFNTLVDHFNETHKQPDAEEAAALEAPAEETEDSLV